MKINREKYKTMHNVFDAHTEKQIYSLIKKGLFEGLESPLSIGKEANVFTAKTKDNETVIVKIYRIMSADFNRMYEYIRTDPRFEDLRSQRRKILFAWVQREFRNLMIARKAQVTVPKAIGIGSNVLVMEYIGDHSGVAKQLKKDHPKKPSLFLEKLLKELRKLYNAGLIHGDLSPFNILNFKEHPVLIDLSSATPIQDPSAKEYLIRDLKNLQLFFTKLGEDLDYRAMLKKITEPF